MEQKNKRFRPTLTEYRALEKKLEEIREKLRIQELESKHLLTDLEATKKKYKTTISLKKLLETSNSLMEKELSKVRSANISLMATNSDLQNEIEYLKTRGFWERVFNL